MQGHRDDSIHIPEMRSGRQTQAELLTEMSSYADVSLIFEPVADVPVTVPVVIEEEVCHIRIRFISGQVLLDGHIEPVCRRMVSHCPVVRIRDIFHTADADKPFPDGQSSSADGAASWQKYICRRGCDISYVFHSVHPGKITRISGKSSLYTMPDIQNFLF